MKIKLDENLSRHLKPLLAAKEHDVVTVADEGMLGHTDLAIARAARKEERMVFSLDREFADIRKYPPGSHPGIVLFRPRTLGPLAVSAFVDRFVEQTDISKLQGCVAIVEPGRLRIRRP